MRSNDLCGALALLALAGCASADVPPPIPPLSLEQYLEGAARVSCEREVRCYESPTVESCLRRGAPSLQSWLGSLDRAQLFADVDAKLTRYDSDAAEACIAGLSVRGCDTSEPLPDACRDVLTGTAKPDAECGMSGIRCAGDAACAITGCDGDCCTGICKRRLPEATVGQACIHIGCAAGGWCRPPGVCVASPGLNEPCGAGCAPGLVCDYSAPAPTCLAPPTKGQSCGATYVCDESWHLACLGAPPTCMERPGPGEDCATLSAPCLGNLACTNGSCAWPPDLDAPCSGGFFCLPGASCDGTRCVPYEPPPRPVCP